MFILLLTLLSAKYCDFSYDKTMKVGDLVVSKLNGEEAIYQILSIEPNHKHNRNCKVEDLIQKNPVFVLKKIFDNKFNFVVDQNKRTEQDPYWLYKLDHNFIQERIKRLQFVEDFLDD
jgi:hypothetical protein